MDKFEAMRVFCSVIEAGGFAPAAERMGLSTSAVSRHVAQLEAHLNVRLLNRTTRRMSPTDEGFAYFERCTQLLADLEETEASVAGEALHPRGRLRLTAPIALATLRLPPAFAAFSRQYPEITLDIQLSDNVADFAEEGLDLAIRVGRVGSENLVARHIGETRLLVAAAPDYLARAGAPAHPNELPRHNCLTFDANGRRLKQWSLVRGSETCTVQVDGDRHSNDAALALRWAQLGHGLVFKAEVGLGDELRSGALVRVLPEWQGEAYPLHAVLPSRRFVPQRVRALVDFLAGKFAAG